VSLELRSLLLWTGVFFALELPAHYGLVPWRTLSSTVWGGEAWWPPVAILVAVFTFVLLCHLEWHWSVRWLIAVTVGGATIILSHLIEQAVRHA
jgi:hypothetical protein